MAHLLQRARLQGQSARAGGRAGLRRRPPSAGAWLAACSRQLAQPRPGSSAPSAGPRYCFFASWHMQWYLVGQSLCCCGMHVLPCNDQEFCLLCSAQLLMVVLCVMQVTPVWRAGPYGPKTLCNACGVRYMKQVKKK